MSIPDMFLTREEKKEKQRRLAETNAAVLAQSVQSEQPAQSIQSEQSVQFVKRVQPEQPEQHPQQLQTRVTPLMFQKPSVRRERLALQADTSFKKPIAWREIPFPPFPPVERPHTLPPLLPASYTRVPLHYDPPPPNYFTGRLPSPEEPLLPLPSTHHDFEAVLACFLVAVTVSPDA